MIKTLHIENYALIRETDVSFEPGFVAITGETGAGKSIMLGALGLLLGQRADTAVLADKGHKCVVEARFDISGLGLHSFFDEADVDYDDLLILRREILPAGKSRAFANDTPVQLPFLKTLAPHLVDIHSQHQNLTLADSTFRLALLDTLTETSNPAESAVGTYQVAYRDYASLKHDLEALTAEETRNRQEQDYLQFQYDELAAANLGNAIDSSDEQALLEAESHLLAHAEAVCQGLSEASVLLDNDGPQSVLAALRQAKSTLSRIASYHPDVETLLGRLDSSLIELDDINSTLLSTSAGITYSPERQQQVDERLALLYRLEKKHGVSTIAELIALRDELDTRLQSMTTLDVRIQTLMEQVDKAFARVQAAADVLSNARRIAGERLAAEIVPLLHDLGMPEARFSVTLAPTPSYGPSGHDSVELLFNANRGGEPRDLSKVASGGELSRLMLAVKAVMHASSNRRAATLLFDEIDSGVSGDISVAVAAIMCRMAEKLQIIAITHLPQIAARAVQHLKVYKQIEDDVDRTVSRIKELTPGERLTEVAVMLSSDPPTPAALQTARELME